MLIIIKGIRVITTQIIITLETNQTPILVGKGGEAKKVKYLHTSLMEYSYSCKKV